MRHIGSLFFVALLMASGIAHGQTDTSTASDVYRVDAESSDIRLLIYRAGVLARLGHNHVICRPRRQSRSAPEPGAVEHGSPDPRGPVNC